MFDVLVKGCFVYVCCVGFSVRLLFNCLMAIVWFAYVVGVLAVGVCCMLFVCLFVCYCCLAV